MPRNTSDTYKIDKYVGKRIFELRKAKSLTRQNLAHNINVSHQQIRKYEEATNRISASKLILIADALSIDVSYFFKGLKRSIDQSEKNEQKLNGKLNTKCQ